ncbi:hypothetical protein ACTWQB_16555 [Piscibacillus sp. B03]|uniref:hypothetical protein n=1 Tax=Piscibacillus sp. B03 TaxID=3457430 RepID=UPI003FCCE28D
MINQLNIKVNNVNFVRVKDEDRVHVHFRGEDPDKQLNVNGYVPVTAEEYEANPGLDGLESLVKEKLTERFTA